MTSNLLKTNLKNYELLSDESIETLHMISKQVDVKKGDIVLHLGEVPKYYYYVEKGLFTYYYLTENGDKVIKKFFPENTFMASLPALLSHQPSLFTIEALENSKIVKIPADKFKDLVTKHHDIALFYIKYLEEKWVKEKEITEITAKFDTANIRYMDFRTANPKLVHRLKQHHIASYLGITPTQLSRINKISKQ